MRQAGASDPAVPVGPLAGLTVGRQVGPAVGPVVVAAPKVTVRSLVGMLQMTPMVVGAPKVTVRSQVGMLEMTLRRKTLAPSRFQMAVWPRQRPLFRQT